MNNLCIFFGSNPTKNQRDNCGHICDILYPLFNQYITNKVLNICNNKFYHFDRNLKFYQNLYKRCIIFLFSSRLFLQGNSKSLLYLLFILTKKVTGIYILLCHLIVLERNFDDDIQCIFVDINRIVSHYRITYKPFRILKFLFIIHYHKFCA